MVKTLLLAYDPYLKNITLNLNVPNAITHDIYKLFCAKGVQSPFKMTVTALFNPVQSLAKLPATEIVLTFDYFFPVLKCYLHCAGVNRDRS